MTGPKVRARTELGVAGQVAVVATVQYEGKEPSKVTFVGSTYGAPGPVVMVTESGHQTFVTNPSRFGDRFGAGWVYRFFAEEN